MGEKNKGPEDRACTPTHVSDREKVRVAGAVRWAWGDNRKQVGRQQEADPVEPLGSPCKARELGQPGQGCQISFQGFFQTG